MRSGLAAAFRGVLGVVSLLALAACGSDDDRLSGVTFSRDLVSGATASVRGGEPAGGALRLTRADLAQILTPVDLITVERTGAQAVIAKIASNSGVETWSSVDKKTVSLRAGVLVASRGLGDDLLGANVPTLSQIAGGGGHTRHHAWIRDDDRAERQAFSCRGADAGASTVTIVERSYAVRHLIETCSGPTGSFRNDYWVQIGGKLRQSRQFVSDGVGYVSIQHLSDGH